MTEMYINETASKIITKMMKIVFLIARPDLDQKVFKRAKTFLPKKDYSFQNINAAACITFFSAMSQRSLGVSDIH